jgi:hypothetical protein
MSCLRYNQATSCILLLPDFKFASIKQASTKQSIYNRVMQQKHYRRDLSLMPDVVCKNGRTCWVTLPDICICTTQQNFVKVFMTFCLEGEDKAEGNKWKGR